MDIPEPVLRLLRIPDSSKVLSVVSPEGFPHSIVLGAVVVGEDGCLYVGEVFMYHTAPYLEADPKAEFLVWKGRVGYSMRVVAEGRVTSGPAFERIRTELSRMGMEAVAAWRFRPVLMQDESATPSSGNRVCRWTSAGSATSHWRSRSSRPRASCSDCWSISWGMSGSASA